MIYFAKIENGLVAQVTVRPDDYQPGEGEALIGPANVVGIGWAYEGGEFVPPFEPDYETEPAWDE